MGEESWTAAAQGKKNLLKDIWMQMCFSHVLCVCGFPAPRKLDVPVVLGASCAARTVSGAALSILAHRLSQYPLNTGMREDQLFMSHLVFSTQHFISTENGSAGGVCVRKDNCAPYAVRRTQPSGVVGVCKCKE